MRTYPDDSIHLNTKIIVRLRRNSHHTSGASARHSSSRSASGKYVYVANYDASRSDLNAFSPNQKVTTARATHATIFT